MKKTFLFLCTSVSFLNVCSGTELVKKNQNLVNVKNNATKKLEHVVVGRQCCTKSVPGPNGSVISMTACAGSFLVSDVTAMTNACAKVDKALGIH